MAKQPFCQWCGDAFYRRIGENGWNFKRRQFCCREHADFSRVGQPKKKKPKTNGPHMMPVIWQIPEWEATLAPKPPRPSRLPK